MSKERKQKNRQEVPPEMAEAQAEAGMPELPPNLPPYLQYKPEPDATASMIQMQAIMQNLDKLLRTNNHVQAHTVAAEHVLPMVMQLADWTMRMQRDLVTYTQYVGSYAVEQHAVAAVPPELSAALLAHFTKAKTAYVELQTLLAVLETQDNLNDAVKEKIDVAKKTLTELNAEADELDDDVDEATYEDEDEDEEDEEEEDEYEDEDEDGEEYDDDEESEDDEPLFDDDDQSTAPQR